MERKKGKLVKAVSDLKEQMQDPAYEKRVPVAVQQAARYVYICIRRGVFVICVHECRDGSYVQGMNKLIFFSGNEWSCG